MRNALAFLLLIASATVFSMHQSVAANLDPARFDGTWFTTVSCPNTNEALAYNYDFMSHVTKGVLHGEHGYEGHLGWLTVDGAIYPDGTSDLIAKGLVGRSAYAQGKAAPGTPYTYHISALFEGSTGIGDRMDGRVCHYSFVKQ